jgi:hypothetical protein
VGFWYYYTPGAPFDVLCRKQAGKRGCRENVFVNRKMVSVEEFQLGEHAHGESAGRRKMRECKQKLAPIFDLVD